jgi:hypothetical protein
MKEIREIMLENRIKLLVEEWGVGSGVKRKIREKILNRIYFF